MSPLFHTAKPPRARAAEPVRLFLANPPLQTCSLGPLSTWRGLCETNPPCSVSCSPSIPGKSTISIRESCHLLFHSVPGFSGWGFSISTNPPRGLFCPLGVTTVVQLQQLCCQRARVWKGSTRNSLVPVCQGDGLFPSYADAQTSLKCRTEMESTSSWKLLLASWLLKTLLRMIWFGKLFGSFHCTFPN